MIYIDNSIVCLPAWIGLDCGFRARRLPGSYAPITEVKIIHMINYGLQITDYMCSIITVRELRIIYYYELRI